VSTIRTCLPGMDNRSGKLKINSYGHIMHICYACLLYCAYYGQAVVLELRQKKARGCRPLNSERRIFQLSKSTWLKTSELISRFFCQIFCNKTNRKPTWLKTSELICRIFGEWYGEIDDTERLSTPLLHEKAQDDSIQKLTGDWTQLLPYLEKEEPWGTT